MYNIKVFDEYNDYFMLDTKEEEDDDRQGGLMDIGLETEEEGDDEPSLIVKAFFMKPLELMSQEFTTSNCWDSDDKQTLMFCL